MKDNQHQPLGVTIAQKRRYKQSPEIFKTRAVAPPSKKNEMRGT
jgi:hypothetical protein